MGASSVGGEAAWDETHLCDFACSGFYRKLFYPLRLLGSPADVV